MQRIGVAFARPRGPLRRRDEYEIVVFDGRPDATKYLRYVGYREQRPDGEIMVGLPLAGPHACWKQALLDFHPGGWDEVRWFEGRDN